MNIGFDEPLFDLAIVLLAGIVGGELVGRLGLPKVTGWIGTGILLRALNLQGLTPGEELDRFLPFMHFVLGYIAFTVGASLHFASLRNSRQRLGLLMLCEATITPVVVFLALRYIGGLSFPVSMLLAAIAIAGAPGTTVLVVQEARAKGILTRTLIAGVGLIDMVAVGVFVFVSAILSTEKGDVGGAVAAVGMEFGLTFGIGLAAAAIMVILTRTIVGPAFLGPSIVFVILASWGAAAGSGVSGILACTFAGFCLSNLQHESIRSAEAYLNQIGGVLFAAFFTFAGMRLDFSMVLPMAAFVALYFFARFFGKYFGAMAAMYFSRATERVRNYLGLALLPHGGVAVGLILLTQSKFGGETSEIGAAVTTIGLATLAINQLLGPSATKLALQRAGEAGLDRARLLDFLDEHHITVNIGGIPKRKLSRPWPVSCTLYRHRCPYPRKSSFDL
ncbi:MAG: cation:proton antiporter [Pirellulaceae bacterium]